MSAIQVPNINFWATLGTLTPAQVDNNFRVLRDFSNTLSNIIGQVFNPDGSLKDDVVATLNIQDLAVTKEKLALDALPFYQDIGGANAIQINVPSNPASYADGQIFYIFVGNTNTGPTTIQVNSLAATPLYKPGGKDLAAGDIVGKGVIAVVYFQAFFRLVGSAASSGSSTGAVNFSGVTEYDSTDVALPGNGFSAAFGHGLGVIPTILDAWLVCETAEAGFVPGQRIPLRDVCDAGGKPALSTVASLSQVIITQNSATIFTNGGTTGLTVANWNLHVYAAVTTANAVTMFPALTFTATRPQGAVSYGQFLFFLQYAQHQGKLWINQIDTVLNKVRPLGLVMNSGSNFQFGNGASFRRANGKDYFVFTSSGGVFILPLQDPGGTWQSSLLFNKTGSFSFKPVKLIEAAGNVIDVYAVSTYNTSVNNINVRHITASVEAVYGTSFDLTTVGAEFAAWYAGAGSSVVLLFQHNPVTGRIYVVTNEFGLLHIFQINNSGNNDFKAWWDLAAGRAAALNYVKTISLPGDGAAWADQRADQLCVEFDLGSGKEKAIAFTRVGNAQYGGSVTRIPWQEG